ncbi:MAG: class I SAM-dependent methyltransferase, partial [Bacteroidetes bacterium]|nr:class I SAM-dependent methyltransferase [Bacteroidota bacterium]
MNELTRIRMIQDCIDVIRRRKKVNYLEIGVETGYCFFKIKAAKKIAVDPDFIIKWTKKLKAYRRNPANFNNIFFELTSDDFFEQKAGYINKIGGLDVVFIDGLHLYEQVLKDVDNALKFLNEGGVILVHDCNPLSEVASVRAYTTSEVAQMNLPGWDGSWNGDVWKAIVKLRSERDDLNIAVYNTDHGVGVITKGQPDDYLRSPAVAGLTYDDLDANRHKFLNLKNPSEFAAFVQKLASPKP